jgi:hypothetical protein
MTWYAAPKKNEKKPFEERNDPTTTGIATTPYKAPDSALEIFTQVVGEGQGQNSQNHKDGVVSVLKCRCAGA